MPINLDELKRLLAELAAEGDAIGPSHLYGLSDLSGECLAHFGATWPRFPVGLRQTLVFRLVELAEANFQVSFDAIFRACLADPDDRVRALAIGGLWENESTHLIGPFLNILRADPSIDVRAAAANGLGRFVLAGELENLEAPIQDRIVIELLTVLHLAGEALEVRCRALESVAYACRPEILEALELAYYEEELAMRISAVVGMGRSCDRKWSPIVLRELESSHAAMRYEAAVAAGELSLPGAVPLLGALIDDPDPQVTQAAIWALGQTAGSAAKQTLLAAFPGADETTRMALDDALGEHALAEGDLSFVLYDLEEGDDSLLPDDSGFVALWPSGEDDEDEDDEDQEYENDDFLDDDRDLDEL